MLEKTCIYLLAILSVLLGLAGEESFISSGEKKICLNMIVKNEKKVIERCLNSVKDQIDYWVIVDTGSNDGTQGVIREVMKGIPGELHERPWVNFGYNRSEALALTKGKADYVLFMDADETLVYSNSFTKFPLEKDFYYVAVQNSSSECVSYERFLLVNNRFNWQWKDILHEYLEIPSEATTFKTLTSVTCLTDSDGFRSEDPQKYYKDAAVLEAALQQDPLNTRYVFYLAQSYFNAKEYELAIQNYEKRASMKGGWDQEAFWSFYAAATLQNKLLKPAKLFITNYCKAYQLNPMRAEPLYRLAEYFNKKGNFDIGYLLAKEAVKLPVPRESMYVQEWIYEYGALYSLGFSSFQLGKYEESYEVWQKVLSKTNVPTKISKQINEYMLLIESKRDKTLL